MNIFLGLWSFSISPRVLSVTFDQQIQVRLNDEIDSESFETGVQIFPAVSGKWSDNRRFFVFTPDEIFPSGQEFTLKISRRVQNIHGQGLDRDYIWKFSTEPSRFTYLGTEEEEAGKVVMVILGGEKKILTDEGLQVLQYQMSSDHQLLYFLAQIQVGEELSSPELFRKELRTGATDQITHDGAFLNKSFVLSPDGSQLVLSRIQLSEAGEYLTRIEGWMSSTQNFAFQKIDDGQVTGTDLQFSPDGKYLLYRNMDDNFELLPLDTSNGEEKIFLGAYNSTYGFSSVKPILALTKYQEGDQFDLRNSLLLFLGDGSKQVLPEMGGLFRDTVFLPNGKGLITIFSGKNDVFDDRESFYPLRIFHLYIYDFETRKLVPLTNDMDFSEENPAVSPDGRHLLFQRFQTLGGDMVLDPAFRGVSDSLGTLQNGGEIWLLDLQSGEMKDLGFRGRQIQFLE